MRTLSFAKGHGTGNDFVILLDRTGLTPVSAAEVAWLCDRHFGIGADGLLRAVRAGQVPEWGDDPRMWFMDYRNADGSIAEMCGNGLRVFARYLVEEGLVPHEPFRVATRAGVRHCDPWADGQVSVSMGRPRLTGQVEVELAGQVWAAQGVDVGNPHAVVLLDGGTALDDLPVHLPPSWQPVEAFPEGVNVEFVVAQGDRAHALRVHERGSGETLSCGTGIVASAVARAAAEGLADDQPSSWQVDVPGGRLTVELGGDEAVLTGPAVVVARGQVHLPDLDRVATP
ncbi:diaminopimelate epimerase [Aestuariimicrobium ganziense]|uniref:diaminopimelate epimerase n=1 Tax=Aestuariimicrobium ganziense TaxID=2773677 RepID=UPI0019443E6B|nr:diaminopimelate epimerase [Aestuariimicrobium ganziense]